MERPSPPAPSGEAERRYALRRHQILDSPPEESFDRITRLAAQLFSVPVALVTLVDEDRQWHKSCFGLDVREVDRNVSFCAHNLDGDEIMVVEDARADDRFAGNPLVTDPPHIRFYAGAPLTTPEGYTLGSLCILDHEPRSFGTDQQAQLHDLAAMVMDELKLRQEVAERRRWETVQDGQNRILEQVASGVPRDRVLDATARFIEDLFDEARASLFLLDPESNTLHVGAAPNLSPGFVQAMEGASIDSNRGTCARAAYHGTDTGAHDIATDPHWRGVRELALAHNVRACWSTPIRGEGDAVLGTFALYYPAPHTPSRADQQFVRLGAHLAGLAIERDRAQQALQDSEERFRGLVSNLPGCVYRCRYDTAWTTLYMSHGLDKIAGYSVDAFECGKQSFKDIMFPGDIPQVREAVREAVDTQSYFEMEYRVCTPDGRIRWIEDIGRPCFDEAGQVQWLDGVMFDVTERKQTEERLRLLETAVNDATESVLITDSELDPPGPRIVYANPGFEAMTGYAPDEVIGKTPRILQGAETDATLLNELRILLERGESFLGETINYRKDGTPFINEWSISPVYDDLGAVTHYVAVQRDITARKQAERALRASEQKYRTVVNNVRDIVFRTDADGRLMFLNAAWTDVTGHAIEASLGQPLSAFMMDDETDDGSVAFEAMLSQERDFCRYEVQLKTREAAPRWMEVFARPVFDEGGQIVSISGTLHDVTKWREAEQKMRTALEKERELGRLKSRFVSMASHELRTPLAAIQSSAELAALFMERGIEAKSAKHLNRIESNVERMTTLLEDVLIFGRVEAGRLPFDPQPMDLSALAAEAVANIRQGIGQAHTVRTEGLDDAYPVEADPQLVRLILTNLLSNAVKYSSEGSRVQLTVARGEEHVRITVADEGIGIPDADLDRLFEPFHRAENVGTRRGTGLGLSILKEVADLHGGHVGVESTEGEGSTFWVTLPHRPAPDPEETAPPPSTNT